MAGIICIETECQVTVRKNRLPLNTEPLMRFISEMYKVPCIYRKVATLSELLYYMKQFRKVEYNKYDIIYFSFHGDTHCIHLEGEKEDLTLQDLAEYGGEAFFGERLVHFSSCKTLFGSRKVAEDFKGTTNARFVSGYTKEVLSDLSAIHDIALFGTYLSSNKPMTAFGKVQKLYQGLQKKLGFIYV